MKRERIIQIRCVNAQDPTTFENAMNEALAGVIDPKITFDKSVPYTAYIEYSLERTLPETVLELLEMVCGNAFCGECPHFEAPTDKRMKWGRCKRQNDKTRIDCRACEYYYQQVVGVNTVGAVEEVLQIPYKASV